MHQYIQSIINGEKSLEEVASFVNEHPLEEIKSAVMKQVFHIDTDYKSRQMPQRNQAGRRRFSSKMSGYGFYRTRRALNNENCQAPPKNDAFLWLLARLNLHRHGGYFKRPLDVTALHQRPERNQMSTLGWIIAHDENLQFIGSHLWLLENFPRNCRKDFSSNAPSLLFSLIEKAQGSIYMNWVIEHLQSQIQKAPLSESHNGKSLFSMLLTVAKLIKIHWLNQVLETYLERNVEATPTLENFQARLQSFETLEKRTEWLITKAQQFGKLGRLARDELLDRTFRTKAKLIKFIHEHDWILDLTSPNRNVKTDDSHEMSLWKYIDTFLYIDSDVQFKHPNYIPYKGKNWLSPGTRSFFERVQNTLLGKKYLLANPDTFAKAKERSNYTHLSLRPFLNDDTFADFCTMFSINGNLIYINEETLEHILPHKNGPKFAKRFIHHKVIRNILCTRSEWVNIFSRELERADLCELDIQALSKHPAGRGIIARNTPAVRKLIRSKSFRNSYSYSEILSRLLRIESCLELIRDGFKSGVWHSTDVIANAENGPALLMEFPEILQHEPIRKKSTLETLMSVPEGQAFLVANHDDWYANTAGEGGAYFYWILHHPQHAAVFSKVALRVDEVTWNASGNRCTSLEAMLSCTHGVDYLLAHPDLLLTSRLDTTELAEKFRRAHPGLLKLVLILGVDTTYHTPAEASSERPKDARNSFERTRDKVRRDLHDSVESIFMSMEELGVHRMHSWYDIFSSLSKNVFLKRNPDMAFIESVWPKLLAWHVSFPLMTPLGIIALHAVKSFYMRGRGIQDSNMTSVMHQAKLVRALFLKYLGRMDAVLVSVVLNEFAKIQVITEPAVIGICEFVDTLRKDPEAKMREARLVRFQPAGYPMKALNIDFDNDASLQSIPLEETLSELSESPENAVPATKKPLPEINQRRLAFFEKPPAKEASACPASAPQNIHVAASPSEEAANTDEDVTDNSSMHSAGSYDSDSSGYYYEHYDSCEESYDSSGETYSSYAW